MSESSLERRHMCYRNRKIGIMLQIPIGSHIIMQDCRHEATRF